MWKAACALFFAWDLVPAQVHPSEGGCEKAIGERGCLGQVFAVLKQLRNNSPWLFPFTHTKPGSPEPCNCSTEHHTLSSALDLEAQPQNFSPGGVTTSPFQRTPQNPQQLGMTKALNTDEPRLRQLTTDPEQNVQAEPDQCRLGQKTIYITQWAGRELGTQAEVLPRSLPWLPCRPFSYNRVQFRRKKTRARLFLLKRTDPLREM